MTTPANKTAASTTTKATPAKKPAAPKAAAAKAPAAEAAPAPVAEKAAPVAKPSAKPAAKKAPAKKAPAKPAAAKTAAPKATPAKTTSKPAPKAEEAPTAEFEAQFEQFSTQLQEGYNEMMQFGKEQMEKFFKVEGVDAFKSYEDAMAFSKENVDAFVKSSSIAAKGVQDVTTLVTEITKAAFEGNVAASKKIFECKTPQEVAEYQAELMKSGYDKLLADATRIQEASTKIAEEASKPLKARFEAGVEKLNEKVA